MLSIESGTLMKQAPALVREELVKMIVENYVPGGAKSLTKADAAMASGFVSYLLRELSEDLEREFLLTVMARQPKTDLKQLASAQNQLHRLYVDGLAKAEAQIPAFMGLAERALHDAIPLHLGVVCLTESGKHPLMWGHYSESHKGALLEFNAQAPCFNRRRHDKDDFGYLRRVRYSENRPTMDMDSSDEEIFSSLALTKPLEWAYEQELRLLWPLSLADDEVETPSGPIHLIRIPPSAVISITVGCKADDRFVAEVISQVVEAQSPIAIRRAVIDAKAFAFHYERFH